MEHKVQADSPSLKLLRQFFSHFDKRLTLFEGRFSVIMKNLDELKNCQTSLVDRYNDIQQKLELIPDLYKLILKKDQQITYLSKRMSWLRSSYSQNSNSDLNKLLEIEKGKLSEFVKMIGNRLGLSIANEDITHIYNIPNSSIDNEDSTVHYCVLSKPLRNKLLQLKEVTI